MVKKLKDMQFLKLMKLMGRFAAERAGSFGKPSAAAAREVEPRSGQTTAARRLDQLGPSRPGLAQRNPAQA